MISIEETAEWQRCPWLNVFVSPSREPVVGVIPLMFMRAGCWQDLQPLQCWPQGFSLARRPALSLILAPLKAISGPQHDLSPDRETLMLTLNSLSLLLSYTPLINWPGQCYNPGRQELGSMACSKNKNQSLVQNAPNRRQGVTWRTIQPGPEEIWKDWLLVPCN